MTHPHVRPWLTSSRLLCAVAASLLGCTTEVPGATEVPAGDPVITPIGGDAGTNGDGAAFCTSIEEGCVCEPGRAPLDCYLDPITVDDRLTCRAGTRYCRAGLWTGCESVVDYELGGSGGGAALLTGPTACNPCDPRCFGYVDRPGPGDLTGGNSSGVSYDATAGGISLTPSAPVTPPLADTDGDGIPDVADSCVGAGAFLDASGGCYGDTFFYHMLPYGGPSVIDPLPIRIQIRTADIYFLMDTTGSMGGELTRLRTDLTTGFFHPTDTACGNGVVGAIRCAIPDAWFGVGYFDDYPVGSYGGAGDLVFRNVRDIDPSLAVVQAGINSLGIHWGNDGPESNTQALWAVASGGGLGPHLTARTGCPAGRWGHPCFRDGTIPIVIHVTDAPFHNGPAIAPGGGYPYAFSWGAGATNVTGNENFGSAYATGNVTAWADYTGTTAGMANDLASPGCGSTNSPEAVFRFTVPATSTVNLSTAGSGYDTVLTLYQEPATVVAAVAGNETFATAHAMTNGPHTLTGTTAGMANDLGNGACGSSGAPEAVFRFTLPSAGTITATTVGSAYDAVLSLWQDVAGTPTYVTCNDDTFGVQSQIIASLAAGTYYIAVDGYASNSGAYQLNFSTNLAATFLTCNDNAVGVTSAISQTLAPGNYYAVVEGSGSASGAYRLGIGTSASTGPTAPVSWTDTINALNARDVRVITLQTCGTPGNWYCDEGTAHANALANGTGSVSGTGVPYVFLGAANGAGLSSAIVNAVVNLANYSRMDISARAVGDTQGFTLLPITATGWGPLGSCLSISGGTQFLGCLPGTQVNFNVSFQNTTVMPTAVAQVFDFFIEVVGDGTIVLERIPVRIVVPPVVATYPATGNYLRDYDSTARCAINERPIWGALNWDVPALPAGTSIRFELSTADSAAALPTATPVATVNVPAAGAGTADVTAVLTAAGALARQYHLRVNAVLNSSPDRLRAPVLSEVQVAYTCIPDE